MEHGMRMIAGAAILVGILAGGCGEEHDSGPRTKRCIAVIPKGTTHEFWKSIHAGAVKAGRERDVDIVWKGPLREDDREGQIALVENMIRFKSDGIVLAPLDDMALRAPVTAAAKRGIPVVIIDSGLNSEDFISFVATDNYKGGFMAGERMIELLKGKGKVIMLRYQEGSASTMKREQGFLDAVGNSKIEVVSANQYGGATTETAYRASENLLAPLRQGGKLAIDGIFCPNESTAFGMLRALQDSGLAGEVRFVGFDSSIKLVEALEKGELDALVLQNPFQMGYLGVMTMVDHLDNLKLAPEARKQIPARVDTGVTLVTRENMNRPAIRELLSPDLAKWLD